MHYENLNEVKRAIGGANDTGKHQQPGGQQRDNSTQDAKTQSNELLALDNSNVIYDNDTEPAGQSSLSPAEESGASDKRVAAKIDGEHRQLSVGFNGNVTQGEKWQQAASANSASFVNSERADEEPQEPQDNYATCLLEPTNVDSDSTPGGHNLTGRLNFWQPVQNRGVMHLVARLRYEVNLTNVANSRSGRERRESFQTLIERAPPSHMELGSSAASSSPVAELDQLKHSMAARNQVVHQIWLNECHLLANSTASETNGRLLAELKAFVTNGSHLVDIDSEATVGHFNLTDTNSIVDKCLHLTQLVPGESTGAHISLAHCRVAQSERLPPVNELDQPASVQSPASNIQPVREELLNSGPTAYRCQQSSVVVSSSPPTAAATLAAS